MNNDINIVSVKNATDFMGVIIDNGTVNLYIPQVLRLNEIEAEKRKDIIRFLKSIEIAKTFIEQSVQSNEKDENGSFWPINDYIWLINDYLEFGTYYDRESQKTVKDGRLDWKRTLRTIPIISNGNIIYDKLQTMKAGTFNSDITNIYLHCINIAFSRLGWIFNQNIHIRVDRIMNVTEMRFCVKKRLAETFDDIKRRRLKALLSILNGVSDDNIALSKHTFGVTNYYYVFEKMVDVFLKGKQDISNYFPSGYWGLEGIPTFKSSELMPDTIYETSEEVFIIDSKMYQYGVTRDISDLPNTSSIQKQITYGDYVANNVAPNKKICNAFILPYDKLSDKYKNDTKYAYFFDRNLAYIGKAYGGWREKRKTHDVIYTFMIDFNFLLKHFSTSDNTFINEICKIIDEKLTNEKLLGGISNS